MDRLVRMSLRLAVAARENLADALRETDTRDPDFAVTLAEVRASRLFTVDELAKLTGLSRSRVYELLAEAEQR